MSINQRDSTNESGDVIRFCSVCRCKKLKHKYYSKNKKGDVFKTCDDCRFNRRRSNTVKASSKEEKAPTVVTCACPKCDHAFTKEELLAMLAAMLE